MTSSATLAEPVPESLVRLAATLAGAEIRACAPAERGGNNRVWRIETADGVLALKVYPRHPEDPRDRLGAEFAALEFLSRHDVDCVPRPLAADRDAGVALYEWIEGGPVKDPGAADIDMAVDFAARLRALSGAAASGEVGAASEACLSAAELASQVEGRFERLDGVAADHDALREFLETGLRPIHAEVLARCRAGYDGAGWDFDAEIPPPARTLSPSDFGFHNALRRPDGRIAFLDFEYFGWDDPVRLAADFVLHPGMRLTGDNRRRFMGGAHAVFAEDEEFPRRLALLTPLIGIRWCLILLNEFLPDRWARRAFAAGPADRHEAQHAQLEKSQALAASLRNADFGFDHDG